MKNELSTLPFANIINNQTKNYVDLSSFDYFEIKKDIGSEISLEIDIFHGHFKTNYRKPIHIEVKGHKR